MRATGLKGHHETLPRSVLHRVGHFKTALVNALEDLQRHTHPGLRAGLAPRFQRLLRLLYKRGNGNPWVTDAKFEAIRRYLAVHAALRPIQGQREILALVGLESRTDIVVGRLAINPGTENGRAHV